jgi:type VI secretion system secreted protein VgrG
MTYALKALGIKLEASTCIELKCGGSSIVLTPAAIFIMGGPLVNINCGSGPPVGPVMAMATSPDAADDASGADKSDPGKDVRYDGATTEYEPLEQEEEEKEKTSWIEIEMVDEAGQPWPGERYEIELPNGKIRKGSLDANGFAHIGNLEPGTVKVRFPRLDAEAWERIR